MSNLIFDPIRNCYVALSPEEKVRQALLKNLVEEKGFNKSLISIEKELDQIPHLQKLNFSSQKRRADIICFAKNIHPIHALYPLLMIECKAHKITHSAIEQVRGYNHYVKAYFVGIVAFNEVNISWYNNEKKEYETIDFIPTYKELILAINHGNKK